MDRETVLAALRDAPIVAAVKDYAGLERSLSSDCQVVFVLFGDILSIPGIVDQIKAAGRTAFVHLDLIDGLSSREIAVSFIRNATKADGVITTKSQLVKRARELGLITVQRFFMIDSIALEGFSKQLGAGQLPDFIEVLPGVMPKILRRLSGMTSIPLIAGGLISDKEDILSALAAGAAAVSPIPLIREEMCTCNRL